MASTRMTHTRHHAPRKVSVWGGRFRDADAFMTYLDITSREGKPMSSDFLTDVRLGDYNLDAAEAVHGDINAGLIRLSHARSFANAVRAQLPENGKLTRSTRSTTWMPQTCAWLNKAGCSCWVSSTTKSANHAAAAHRSAFRFVWTTLIVRMW